MNERLNFKCLTMTTGVLFAMICFLVVLHQSDGYAHLTQKKMKIIMMLLIRDLYYGAEMNTEKLKFVQRWAMNYKGVRTGVYITKTQEQYQYLIRLYINALDNVDVYNETTLIDKLIIAKRVGMEIEHKTFLILEYEKTDTSGVKYGRSGGHQELSWDDFPGVVERRSRNVTRVKQANGFMDHKIRRWSQHKGYNTGLGKNPYNRQRSRDIAEDGFDSEKD